MKKGDFTGRAEGYGKFRPSYPAELIRYVFDASKLGANALIADVGAGTGKFTRLLLEQGAVVAAVEPNDDMRQIMEQELSHFAGFSSIKADAEATGLPSQSIDLVTVAQAFHWFDKARFREECRRILKPNGLVLLVWNNRDPSSRIVQESAEICRHHCPNFDGFSGPEREKQELFDAFYRNGIYEKRVFRSDILYDLDGWIGRNLSSSYAPKPVMEAFDSFVTDCGALFERYQQNGLLLLPNTTQSYLGMV